MFAEKPDGDEPNFDDGQNPYAELAEQLAKGFDETSGDIALQEPLESGVDAERSPEKMKPIFEALKKLEGPMLANLEMEAGSIKDTQLYRRRQAQIQGGWL